MKVNDLDAAIQVPANHACAHVYASVDDLWCIITDLLTILIVDNFYL